MACQGGGGISTIIIICSVSAMGVFFGMCSTFYYGSFMPGKALLLFNIFWLVIIGFNGRAEIYVEVDAPVEM